MAKLEWNGPEVRAALRARTAANLRAAAVVVQNRAKVLLSTAYPPPSSAGEPPHRRTGRLRASVTSEVDEAELTARVGSDLPVARWLELGTSRMPPRPWLRRALAECRDQIAALFSRT